MGETCVFKPLRFNKLLKAMPGMAHLQLTPHAAQNAKTQTYVRVLFSGYQVVAELEDSKKVMLSNERIIRNHQHKK